MQGVAVLTNAWKHWGLQAPVLLSFTLQVVLLVLAEFRRRIDSGVLRLLVWSAYMLADATAIYVLGHMSVTSSTSGKHELMAFWAPFLLLHLGGQDNITAYAVEDNQLWLRHLQMLAVQVASAGYVLFESPIIGSRSLLRPATIVMFMVGVLKYGERVWTLKCASSNPSGNNYRSFDRSTASAFGLSSSPSQQNPRPQDREAFLLIAHQLLDAPMDLLKGPSTFLDVHHGTSLIHGEDLYKVAEMQLSLMHDVFYTKADVTHSWYGLCVRVVSLLGTAASLLLFHLHLVGRRHRQHPSKDDDGYSRVDVVISYVLLLGAIVLEIISALRAIFSSWTFAFLDQRAQERNVWHVLAGVVGSLRQLVHATDWWRSSKTEAIHDNCVGVSTGNAGDSSHYKKILDKGTQLGAKLIDDKLEESGASTPMLELIAHVWMEILCYVGYRCSAYSLAKQLGSGGELITIAALLMEHIRRRTPMP
ncbi:hypothetical protein U9M48_030672 [Paspalum notatum var. saurae]|uniref:DUF4220 domain-containing protein n=1 Tax=Paspalum notatum var. saurae TaxID=547442 RepID=A0AAQ3U0U8_PASNO